MQVYRSQWGSLEGTCSLIKPCFCTKQSLIEHSLYQIFLQAEPHWLQALDISVMPYIKILTPPYNQVINIHWTELLEWTNAWNDLFVLKYNFYGFSLALMRAGGDLATLKSFTLTKHYSSLTPYTRAK